MNIRFITIPGIILLICISLYSCDKDCSPATQYIKLAPGDTGKLVYKGKEIIRYTSNSKLDTISGKGSTLQIEYNGEQVGANCSGIQLYQEQRSVLFSSSTKNDFRIGIKTILGEEPRYFISFNSGAKYGCTLKKLDGPADIDTLTINHHQYQNIYKIPADTGSSTDIIALYNKSYGLLHLKLPSGQMMDIARK